MTHESRTAWNRPTGQDTLLNGALIAAGIVGLLLAVLVGPAPVASPSIASGMAVSESAQG